MKDSKKNIWLICFVIACVVILALASFIIFDKVKGTLTKSKSTTADTEDSSISIRVDEDLSMKGKVENLEDVSFGHVRITQYNGKTRISVMLNNESKDKAIEAKTLTINLLDKDGAVIAKGTTEMKEIKENLRYTNVDLEMDMPNLELVYNIQIIAE